ncbi:MAG: sodium/solute symporter [Pseudomonadota bacterium]
MTTIDWTIIIVYMAGMIGLSIYLGRGQANDEDYYVGGRNLPWWAVGISTMATQTSAISFMSIPAYVALKEGGGLTWLQYELAVPLAMIFVMIFLIPFFRRLELVSVYEYLELRFGPQVRLFLSGVFLLSRGFATAIGLYASAIVLSVCLDLPLAATILLIGVITVIYDTIGGMTAVVYSDVLQMFILVGGLLACVFYAAAEVGGFSAMFDALPQDRWHAFDPGTGLGDSSSTPFWGFLIGGFFLYASYYGTDQSQVQRELSAPTLADTKKALVFNGLARFPLTLLYLLLGIAAGATYYAASDLQAAVPPDKLDYLVPQFILLKLPTGLRALLFAALLAAAMSSLDSALNSLSAATVRDFIDRKGEMSGKAVLRTSKVTTVVWGAVLTGLAFFAGNISDTVIEGINKVGSAFYGPILAAFLAGVASKRATGPGVIAGVIAGVGFNVVLWIGTPEIYWMWWNAFGLVVAIVVTLGASLIVGAPPSEEVLKQYTLTTGEGLLAREREWLPTYGLLFAYFALILVVTLLLGSLGA